LPIKIYSYSLEVSDLLVLLEAKFRNPQLSLGPDGFQMKLASSGLLTEAEMREFIG
jgi:hypothetical protein